MYIYFWQLLNHIILLLFLCNKMSTYFQTHNLTVSRVPRGGPGAEQGKVC